MNSILAVQRRRKWKCISKSFASHYVRHCQVSMRPMCKTTATGLKMTIEDMIMQIAQVDYKESQFPILNLVESVLLSMVHKGRLGKPLIRKMYKLKTSGSFKEALMQRIGNDILSITLVLTLVNRHVESIPKESFCETSTWKIAKATW